MTPRLQFDAGEHLSEDCVEDVRYPDILRSDIEEAAYWAIWKNGSRYDVGGFASVWLMDYGQLR